MPRKHLWLLLLFSTLTACGISPQPARPATIASTAIAVSTSISSIAMPAILTPITSPSFTPTPRPPRYAPRRPTITATPTQTPTITPTSVPVVAAPPGLIYSDGKGQWQIAADGKPDLIIEYPDAVLSPNRQMAIVPAYHQCIVPPCYYHNGDHYYRVVDLNSKHEDVLGAQMWGIQWSPDSQYVYYTLEDDNNHLSDVWVIDVATHARRNLSRTPRRHEGSLVVWPGQPDYLFFYSWPVDVIADGEGWLGYPTIMKTDGTEYQVVSTDLGTGLLALSPDGRTIAFSDWERAWYYRRGESAQLFPWQDFGLAGLKNIRFNFPSWSADGQKIAWSMSGEDRTGHIDGVSVFDLQTGIARLLKDWNYIEWSPSQRWITGARDGSKPGGAYGVWVANANVENAHLLTEIFNSIDGKCSRVWSPDENWLAFNCVNAVDLALNDGIWLAELETGQLLKTNLPDEAQIRGWVNPQP